MRIDNRLQNERPFEAVGPNDPIVRAITTRQAMIGNIEDSVLDFVAPFAGQSYTTIIDNIGNYETLHTPIDRPDLRFEQRRDQHIGTTFKEPYHPLSAAAAHATLAQRELLRQIRQNYEKNLKVLDNIIDHEWQKESIKRTRQGILRFQEALGDQALASAPEYLSEYAEDAMEFLGTTPQDPNLQKIQKPLKALKELYKALPSDSKLHIRTNDPRSWYTTGALVMSELATRTLTNDEATKAITIEQWRNWISSAAEIIEFGVNTILKPIRNQILAETRRSNDKNTIVSIRPKTLHKLIEERTKHLPKAQRARVLWFLSISGLAQISKEDPNSILSLDAIIESLDTAKQLFRRHKRIKTKEGLARLVRDTYAAVIGNAGHTSIYESTFKIYNSYYESRRRPQLYGQQTANVSLQQIQKAVQNFENDPTATRAISRNQGLLPFLSGQRNYIHIIDERTGKQVSPLEYAETLQQLQQTAITTELEQLFKTLDSIPIRNNQIAQQWVKDLEHAIKNHIRKQEEITRQKMGPYSTARIEHDFSDNVKRTTKIAIQRIIRIKEFAKDGVLTDIEYGELQRHVWYLESLKDHLPNNSPVKKFIQNLSNAFNRMEWLKDAAHSVVPTTLQNTTIDTLYYGLEEDALLASIALLNPVSRTVGMVNSIRMLASKRGGFHNEIIESELSQIAPDYTSTSATSRFMTPVIQQISAWGDAADILTNTVTRPIQQLGIVAYKHIWGGMPSGVGPYPWGELYDIQPYIANWIQYGEESGLGRSTGAFMAMQVLSMSDPASIGITIGSMALGPTGIGRALTAAGMSALRTAKPLATVASMPLRSLSAATRGIRTRWMNTRIATATRGRFASLTPRIATAQRYAQVAMIHGTRAIRYGYGANLAIGDIADIIDAYQISDGDTITVLTALATNPEYFVRPRRGLAQASILIQPALERIGSIRTAITSSEAFIRPEIRTHYTEQENLLRQIQSGPEQFLSQGSSILFYDRGDNQWKVGQVELYNPETQTLTIKHNNRSIEGVSLSQTMRMLDRSLANNQATIQSGLAGASLSIIDTIRNKTEQNITVTKSAIEQALGELGKKSLETLQKGGIIEHDAQTDQITLTDTGQTIATTLSNPSESVLTTIATQIAEQTYPKNKKEQQKFVRRFIQSVSQMKAERKSLYILEAILQPINRGYASTRTVLSGAMPLRHGQIEYKYTTGYAPIVEERKPLNPNDSTTQIEAKYTDPTKTLPQNEKYITVEDLEIDLHNNPDAIDILADILSTLLDTPVSVAGIKTDPNRNNIVTGVAYQIEDKETIGDENQIERKVKSVIRDLKREAQYIQTLEQKLGVHNEDELALLYTLANVLLPLTNIQNLTIPAARAMQTLESYQTNQGPLYELARSKAYLKFAERTAKLKTQTELKEKQLQAKEKEIENLKKKIEQIQAQAAKEKEARKQSKTNPPPSWKIAQRNKGLIKLREALAKAEQEYKQIAEELDQKRKQIRTFQASGDLLGEFLKLPNALPKLNAAITAQTAIEKTPQITIDWGFDAINGIKTILREFIGGMVNKEFYQQAYKQVYIQQLQKRMQKHIDQFSPEQIEQIIKESVEEWKETPSTAYKKIIQKVTNGNYDETTLTDASIFQSALARLGITVANINNLEELIGAYFLALQQKNSTLAAMFITQIALAISTTNSLAEEISKMANLTDQEKQLIKETALESIILSTLSMEAFLDTSPTSAATIDEQGNATTYKELLEQIKQKAIAETIQNKLLPKLIQKAAKDGTEDPTEISERITQFSDYVNDLLKFYEIASVSDFEEAYAWAVQNSKIYPALVDAFGTKHPTAKAKQLVRETLLAHYNMANANYTTLYSDRQTLKYASRHLTEQPELIEALLFPLTQYATTATFATQKDQLQLPRPHIALFGNAILSTTAITEEAIHAMADLISAKIIEQTAQTEMPAKAELRYIDQIPLAKALVAYYSLDLDGARRRTAIQPHNEIIPEEIIKLLNPIEAQERIIDTILTHKLLEDHANPLQALVAAGAYGGERIRERISQHATYALQSSLRDPNTISKIEAYIEDSRLYLATKADVTRYAAELKETYHEAVTQLVEEAMGISAPLANLVDYFVATQTLAPNTTEKEETQKKMQTQLRYSQARDPDSRSETAKQTEQKSQAKIVLEQIIRDDIPESIKGIPLATLATIAHVQKYHPDLLQDPTLNPNNIKTKQTIADLTITLNKLAEIIRKAPSESEDDILSKLAEYEPTMHTISGYMMGLRNLRSSVSMDLYTAVEQPDKTYKYYKIQIIIGARQIRINKVETTNEDTLRILHNSRFTIPFAQEDPARPLIGKIVSHQGQLYKVKSITNEGKLIIELVGSEEAEQQKFNKQTKTFNSTDIQIVTSTKLNSTKAGQELYQNGIAYEKHQSGTETTIYIAIDPIAIQKDENGQVAEEEKLSTWEKIQKEKQQARQEQLQIATPIEEKEIKQSIELGEQPVVLFTLTELLRTLGWKLPALNQTSNETIIISPNDEEIYTNADHGITTLTISEAIEYLKNVLESLKQQAETIPDNPKIEVYLGETKYISSNQDKKEIQKRRVQIINRINNLIKKLEEERQNNPETQVVMSTTLELAAQDVSKPITQRYYETIQELIQEQHENDALKQLFEKAKQIRQEKGLPTQQMKLYLGPRLSYMGNPKSITVEIGKFLIRAFRYALNMLDIALPDVHHIEETMQITTQVQTSAIQWPFERPRLRNQPKDLKQIQEKINQELRTVLRKAGIRLSETETQKLMQSLQLMLSATIRSKQPVVRSTPDPTLGILGVSPLGTKSAQPTIEYIIFKAMDQPFAIGIQHAPAPNRPKDRSLTGIILLPNFKEVLTNAYIQNQHKIQRTKIVDPTEVQTTEFEISKQILADLISPSVTPIPTSTQSTPYGAYSALLHIAAKRNIIFKPDGETLTFSTIGNAIAYPTEPKYRKAILQATLKSIQTLRDELINKDIPFTTAIAELTTIESQLSNTITQQAVPEETIDTIFQQLHHTITKLASQFHRTVLQPKLEESLQNAIKTFYNHLPVTAELQAQQLEEERQYTEPLAQAPNPEAMTDPTEATPTSEQNEPRKLPASITELRTKLGNNIRLIAREIVERTIQEIKDLTQVNIPAILGQLQEQKGIDIETRTDKSFEQLLQQFETNEQYRQQIIRQAIEPITQTLQTTLNYQIAESTNPVPYSVDPLAMLLITSINAELNNRFVLPLIHMQDTQREQIKTQIESMLTDESARTVITAINQNYQELPKETKSRRVGVLAQTLIVQKINNDEETQQQIIGQLRFSAASQEGVPTSLANIRTSLPLKAILDQHIKSPYFGIQNVAGIMNTPPKPHYHMRPEQTSSYQYFDPIGTGYAQEKTILPINHGMVLIPSSDNPFRIGQGVITNISTTTGLLAQHIHKLATIPEPKIYDNQAHNQVEQERQEIYKERIIYYETPHYIIKADIADLILFLYLGIPYKLTPAGNLTYQQNNQQKEKPIYALEEDDTIAPQEKQRALENALSALHTIFAKQSNNPIHVPPGILGKLPSDPSIQPTTKRTELGITGNIIEYANILSNQTQHNELWLLPTTAQTQTIPNYEQIKELARIITIVKKINTEDQIRESYEIIQGNTILQTIEKQIAALNQTNPNTQQLAERTIQQDIHTLLKSLIAAGIYTIFSNAANTMHQYSTAPTWHADLEQSLMRILETINPEITQHTRQIISLYDQTAEHTPFARNGAYQAFGNIDRIITNNHNQYTQNKNYQINNTTITTIPSYATIAQESLETDEAIDPRMDKNPYYQTTKETVDPFDRSEYHHLLDIQKESLAITNPEDQKEATVRYIQRRDGYLIKEQYGNKTIWKIMRGQPAPIMSDEMRLINAYTQYKQALEFSKNIGGLDLEKGNIGNVEVMHRTALLTNGFFIRKIPEPEDTDKEIIHLFNTHLRFMFSELFSIPPVMGRNKNIDAIPIAESATATVAREGIDRIMGAGIRNSKYWTTDIIRLGSYFINKILQKPTAEPNLFEIFDSANGVGVNYTYTPTSIGGQRMGAYLYTAGAAITNFKLKGMSFLSQLSRLVISLDVGTFVPLLASGGPIAMASILAYMFGHKIDQYLRSRNLSIFNPIALTSAIIQSSLRSLRYIAKAIAFSMFTDNMHAIYLHRIRKHLKQKYLIKTTKQVEEQEVPITEMDLLREIGNRKGRDYDAAYQENVNAITELLRNYGLDPANTPHLTAHAAAAARTFGYQSILPTRLEIPETEQELTTEEAFVESVRPYATQIIQELEETIRLYEKQAATPLAWVKPKKPTERRKIELGEYQPNEQLLSAITKALSLLAELSYNTATGKIQAFSNIFQLSHGIPGRLTANYGVATLYMNLLLHYMQDNKLPFTNTNLTQDLITIARAILHDLKSPLPGDQSKTPFWQALAEAAILRRYMEKEERTRHQQTIEEQGYNKPMYLRAHQALHTIREITDVIDVPKYQQPDEETLKRPDQWIGIQYLTTDRESDDERILSAIPIAFTALKNKNKYRSIDYFRGFTRAIALFEATLHNSPYSVNMVRGVLVQTMFFGTQAADLAHKIEGAHIQRSYGIHTLMQIMSESSALLAPKKPTAKTKDIATHTFYAITQLFGLLQSFNTLSAAIQSKIFPRGSNLGTITNIINNYGSKLLALAAVGMLAAPHTIGTIGATLVALPFIGRLLYSSIIFGMGIKGARQLVPPMGNLFSISRKAFATNVLYPNTQPLAKSLIEARYILYNDPETLKQYAKRKEDVDNLSDEMLAQDTNITTQTTFNLLQALNIYGTTLTTSPNPEEEENWRITRATTPEIKHEQPRKTIRIKLNRRFQKDPTIQQLINNNELTTRIRNAIIAALNQYYNPITQITQATIGTSNNNTVNIIITINNQSYKLELFDLNEIEVEYSKTDRHEKDQYIIIKLPTISTARLAQQLLAIALHEHGLIQLQTDNNGNYIVPAINDQNPDIQQVAQTIYQASENERNNIQGAVTISQIEQSIQRHFVTVKQAIANIAAHTLSDGQSKAILVTNILQDEVTTTEMPIQKIKEEIGRTYEDTKLLELTTDLLLTTTRPIAQELEKTINPDTPITNKYTHVNDLEIATESPEEFKTRRLLEEIITTTGGNPEPIAQAIEEHFSTEADKYYDNSLKFVAKRIKQIITFLMKEQERIERRIEELEDENIQPLTYEEQEELQNLQRILTQPHSRIIARLRAELNNRTNFSTLTEQEQETIVEEIVRFIIGLLETPGQMTLQTAAIIDQLRATNNALGQKLNSITHEDANGIYLTRLIELLTLTDPERETPPGYIFGEDGLLTQITPEQVQQDLQTANETITCIAGILRAALNAEAYAPIDPDEIPNITEESEYIENLKRQIGRLEEAVQEIERQMNFTRKEPSLAKHALHSLRLALSHLHEALVRRELLLKHQNTTQNLQGEDALDHYANAMILRANIEQASYELNKTMLLINAIAENDREIILFMRAYKEAYNQNDAYYPIIKALKQRILHKITERIPNISQLSDQEIALTIPSIRERIPINDQTFRDTLREARAVSQITTQNILSERDNYIDEAEYRFVMSYIANTLQTALTLVEKLPNSFLNIYTMDLTRGFLLKEKTTMDDIKAIQPISPATEFVKQIMEERENIIRERLQSQKNKQKKTHLFIEEVSDTVTRIGQLIVMVSVQAAHRARTPSQAFNNTLNLYSRAPQFYKILNALSVIIFSRKMFSLRKLIHMPLATKIITLIFALQTIFGWFVAPIISTQRAYIATEKYKIMMSPREGNLLIEAPDSGTQFEIPILGQPASLGQTIATQILQGITTNEGYSEETTQEVSRSATEIASTILQSYFGAPTINTSIATRLTNAILTSSTNPLLMTKPSFTPLYGYEYPIGTLLSNATEEFFSAPLGLVPRDMYRKYTTQDPRIEQIIDLQRTDRINILDATIKGTASGLGFQYYTATFPYGSTNHPKLLELRPDYSQKTIVIREYYTTTAANTLNGAPYTALTINNPAQFGIIETDSQQTITTKYHELGWLTRTPQPIYPYFGIYNLEQEKYINELRQPATPGRDFVRELTELTYLSHANLSETQPDVNENPFLLQQLKQNLLAQAFNKPYTEINTDQETMFFGARSITNTIIATQIPRDQYANQKDPRYNALHNTITEAFLIGTNIEATNILAATPIELQAIYQDLMMNLNTGITQALAGNIDILETSAAQTLIKTAESLGEPIKLNIDTSQLELAEVNQQVAIALREQLIKKQDPHQRNRHGAIILKNVQAKPNSNKTFEQKLYEITQQEGNYTIELIPYQIRQETTYQRTKGDTEQQMKERAKLGQGIAIIIKQHNTQNDTYETIAAYGYHINILTKGNNTVKQALSNILETNIPKQPYSTRIEQIKQLAIHIIQPTAQQLYELAIKHYATPQTITWAIVQESTNYLLKPEKLLQSTIPAILGNIFNDTNLYTAITAIIRPQPTEEHYKTTLHNLLHNPPDKLTMKNINTIETQHTYQMIQWMIEEARNKHNKLNQENQIRNQEYIRWLEELQKDPRKIELITQAANAAAKQTLNDIQNFYLIEPNSTIYETLKPQILRIALYGTIITHYADTVGYNSVFKGQTYPRPVYPRNFILPIHYLKPQHDASSSAANELMQPATETLTRIKSTLRQLGNDRQPPEQTKSP